MTSHEVFQHTKEQESTIGLNTDGDHVGITIKRHPDSESTRKPRKKRKTYSCGVCRKFKTRCDFEPMIGRCHRCNVLNLECSLTKEREEEILAAIETSSGTTLSTASTDSHTQQSAQKSSWASQPVASTLNNRLNKLEANLSSLNSKLDLLVMLAQGTNSAATTSTTKNKVSVNLADSNLQDKPYSTGDEYSVKSDDSDDRIDDRDSLLPATKEDSHTYSRDYHKVDLNGLKLQEPPLKLISDIDERLFPTKAKSEKDRIAKTQRPFVVARSNFFKFFNQHEQLCLYLSRDFLVKSHFWIIPGGVKEINRPYVERHVFITSVFAIIAMGFDENNKYEDEQEIMYPLVERLLTNTLTMFERLTDHDIEAILYCSMFNVSRKSKRHRQMKFNSLVLTNFAISSLLNIVDFHKIKERVLMEEDYDALDLYHLRILNSLTACRLQYSIGYGSFLVPDELLKDFNNLTARYPQANFGDDIKISEINLSEIVNHIFLNFKSYFKNFTIAFKAKHKDSKSTPRSKSSEGTTSRIPDDPLTFPELEYWLKNWDELLSKDGGGVLLFAYNYYYIMICRSFLTEFYEEYQNDLYFFKSVLKTMKTYCFTLLDGFLKLPSSLIKGAPVITVYQLVFACLTLCDFLHFFNASERQQILNLCTRIYWHLHTIGEKLNEATENVGKIIKSLIETGKKKVNTGSEALASTDNHLLGTHSSPYAPLQTILNNVESPKSVMSATSHASGAESTTAASFNMPDVDQFNSFEDFFQDFFENLKPTTQTIFSSINHGPH
ncbi:LANO_0G00848g1_1 [Lachancea nothofagi CBS 11611]|uniref:LANO_0G00848g1_1 n=1 Tax=Lachancea nothofagi CBS 11611 TaxID=1266666 RepID=A0A1G4KED6_9SACH|nr:LANO_0G00848g1_1 [Lachancea nothofagi CBS 11611]